MEQIILWFNILGFTLLFGSLGTTHILYRRANPPWLKPYLLYLAVYAFFTIVNTYRFFMEVYLPPATPPSGSVSLFFAFFIALVLLVLVPLFVLSLFGRKMTAKQWFGIIAMAAVFPVMLVVALVNPAWPMDRLGSIYLNVYLGGVTLYGIIKVEQLGDRSPYGVIIPFLRLSCVLYFFVALQPIIMPLILSPPVNQKISILTAGIISFIWGTVTLGYLLFAVPPQEGLSHVVLTDAFATGFGLTPREKEIINLLLKGKNNREIGEKLFISPRTVETHIYNIYRKCSVKNKMELAGKIAHTL